MSDDVWITVDEARRRFRWTFWKRWLLRTLAPLVVLSMVFAAVIQATSAEPFNAGNFLLVSLSGPSVITLMQRFLVWPWEKRRNETLMVKVYKRRLAEVQALYGREGG